MWHSSQVYEKLEGVILGRLLTADVPFLPCVNQKPDICDRERTFVFILFLIPKAARLRFYL